LLTKNPRTKQPNKGLNSVKVGPFLILDQKRPVTYTLDLPADAKIHPRFHINMLELADPATPLQKTFYFKTEEDSVFEVERILAHQDNGNGTEYLIKWLGYLNSENTWEPDTNLTNCRLHLRKYHGQQQKHRSTPL
jgi:hypothetical protein